MEPRILNMTQARAIAEVLELAIHGSRVGWVDSYSGDVLYGTARHVCHDESGNFLNGEDDVRDAYLRITTAMGFELFMPMAQATEMVLAGTLCAIDHVAR